MTALEAAKKTDDYPQLVVPTSAILDSVNSCPSPRGEKSPKEVHRVRFVDFDQAIAYALRQDGDYSFIGNEEYRPDREQ